MTFSVVIRCGRDWTPGDPCRQAEPLGVVDGFGVARQLAARVGWSTIVEDGAQVDRCPACTRRETEGGTRRRSTDRRPVDDTALPELTPDGVRGIFAPLLDALVPPPVPVTRPFADAARREQLTPTAPDPITADCTLPCCRRRSHPGRRA